MAETYLNPEALVALAGLAGADAIHPGYGFLSENPELPEACARAGIVWVGPTPESMRVMGHKVRAKETVVGRRRARPPERSRGRERSPRAS